MGSARCARWTPGPLVYRSGAMSVTVAVDGELDAQAVEPLRGLVDHLLAENDEVVLDLAGLTFVDSAGVRFLWETCVNGHGRRVSLVRAHGLPARVLRLTGLPVAEAEA
jgi:anti-sigma B factor antagonist